MGLVVLGLIGCTRNQEIDIRENGLTLVARTESPDESRTVVEEGVHVFWEPGDEIAVFMGEKMAKFSTDITAASGTATFKGTFGDSKWPEEPDIWAVYPFSEDVAFDGETITTTLPSEQVAREGSFGKDMNLAIAHSTSSSLQFYNVGGGIRFRLTQEGIKKVTFEGYGGEILSGTVKIGFDENGKPVVREVTEGSRVITLLPPSGNDSFPTNVWFYCVAIPGTLTSGYKLEFYRESEYSRIASDKAVTIKRSIFGSIDNADEGCEFIPIPNTIATPDAIDLGLPSGLKWASFNVGATKPEEYGDYYAWGEVAPKNDYSWSSYKWCKGQYYSLTKYCSDPSRGYNDFTDSKTVLEPEDDAAHMNLGRSWRMPTDAEFAELQNNCIWEWTSLNGINGQKITGPNGNSIFLPGPGFRDGTDLKFAGDLGYYWSSSLYTTDPDLTYDAWQLSSEPGYVRRIYSARFYGFPIRPVYDDGTIVPSPPVPEAIDLGLSVKWASFNLGASKPEEYGDYYAWGETEPYYSSLEPLMWKEGKESGYDWSSYKWCMGAENTLTKYCNNSHYGYNGFTDGKTTLDQEDDAAYVNLGDKWRMPTMAEWTELRTNCTWTADVQDGVWGYIVKSLSNGKHIFLPRAGELRETRQNNVGSYGYYWSSSLYEEIPRYSQYLFFIISADPSDIRESYLNRYLGNTIRSVYDD